MPTEIKKITLDGCPDELRREIEEWIETGEAKLLLIESISGCAIGYKAYIDAGNVFGILGRLPDRQICEDQITFDEILTLLIYSEGLQRYICDGQQKIKEVSLCG